ncbi:MAG: nitroreductase [Gallicola sp.]|uniref:nitroreductase family protein n=1 Tax=Gallicola sp. Sow4_E12 TaxID=3438785 RepID=UPI0017CD6C69|nr:nitroreductase [Gallicola sp.]
MTFYDLAKRRYSVRQFTKERIPRDKLESILEAARLAPTSQNDQPQRLFILESETARENLNKAMNSEIKAPLYVLVAYDKRETRTRNYPVIDGGTVSASIVATYLMLEASDTGLGSIWIGDVDLGKLKTVLNLEEYIVPIGIIAIGFPMIESKPGPSHANRKPLEETTFYL